MLLLGKLQADDADRLHFHRFTPELCLHLHICTPQQPNDNALNSMNGSNYYYKITKYQISTAT